MAVRILRISTEGTFGPPHATAKQTFDLLQYASGQYKCKFTRLNEALKKESTTKNISAEAVSKMLDALLDIKLPAFPDHAMGCDGDFTEIEVGGYGGKSHFRWWSCPPAGWEELDKVTQEIIDQMSFD